MSKRPSEKYYPGNVPDTLPALVQFLFDELFRISEAIRAFPVGMNVKEARIGVPITTTPTEDRLFEGAAADLDLPGGGWDSVLGEWTVPVNGLYQININSVVAPFGAGNKDYAAEIKLYIDNVERWSNADAGQDNFRLSCSLAASGFLFRESVIRVTITLVHDQFVGSTTVTSFMGITSTAQQ